MPVATLPDKDSLVLVPTFNEAANVEQLIDAVLEASTEPRFDVLVIDDNSPDGTGAIADACAAARADRVNVAHRPAKLGLASAYIAGFRYALANGYRHVFEMDADLSHDPIFLPTLRAELETADVVLGSRYVRGGAAPGAPRWRRALSRSGSAYAAAVLGLPFHDLTGGFKGFRAAVLASLDLEAIRSNGYAFQIEVTYRCYRRGFRIVEHPIVFWPRLAGRSKMHARIVAEALLVVWRLRMESPGGGLGRRVPT
jgi:dolichol-phosphate mannosyltransferase